MAAVQRLHGSLTRHMRVFLIALCACGAAEKPAPPSPVQAPVAAKKRALARVPIDVIEVLGKPAAEASWIVPGPAQLELGGASVQPLDAGAQLEVDLLEEQGNDVRVGVRLDHARFALWMARSRLLGVIVRDQRVIQHGAFVPVGVDPMQAVLHDGALVQRLAKKDDQIEVRYVGALEVQGWVPTDVLADREPAGRQKHGRIPTGRRPLMLMPGAIVRAEPQWSGAQLAVLNEGYFVDLVKDVDDAWSEISYDDDDVFVHGYVSKQDPPGRVHRRKQAEQSVPATPNATAPDHTCLYVGGEPVGFIVGDEPVVLDRTDRVGWFTLTIDTPWGPIAFDAKGATETELGTCAS